MVNFRQLKQLLESSCLMKMVGRLQRAPWWGLLDSAVHPELVTVKREQVIAQRLHWVALFMSAILTGWTLLDLFVWSGSVAYSTGLRLITASILCYLASLTNGFEGRLHPRRLLMVTLLLPLLILGAGDAHNHASPVADYQVLSFVLLSSVALFPLTVAESFLVTVGIVAEYLWTEFNVRAGLPLGEILQSAWPLVFVSLEALTGAVLQTSLLLSLVRDSVKDNLTGAFTRRGGKELIALQYARYQRDHIPFSIVFFDIDYFKSVNDKFGHDVGDTVLREASLQLQRTFRTGDLIVRWGGEEFLIVLPRTDIQAAAAAAERARVQGLGARPDGEPLTASMGVAGIEEIVKQYDGAWEDLINKADARLYHAKETGRNRVVWRSEP